MAGIFLFLLPLNSCTTADRVVYLGANTTKTVRLRETVKGVKVWYKDSTGVSLPGKADLLEGGYYREDIIERSSGAIPQLFHRDLSD